MSVSWHPDTFHKAWLYASEAHQGQFYAGPVGGQGFPYIHHIAAVAMELIHALEYEQHCEGDLAVQCALLHDTIEDTATDFATLEQRFGEAVASGVQALSKDERIADKRERMSDSLQRIKAQPREVGMVKLADRICNLAEPPAHWNQEKRRAYRDESLLILQQLSDCSEVLATRLRNRINEYSRFIKTN